MEDIIDDDDFGDLYADVEVLASTTINGISNFTGLCVGEDDNSTKCAGSGSKNVDELIPDDELMNEMNGERLEVDNGSDSEDDLNIVLNDEDDASEFPVNLRNGGFDEDEEEDGGFEVVGEGDELGKRRNSSDQSMLGDGLEVSANGGGEKGNGSKGSYQSQYKYIRHCGDSFPANVKPNGYTAVSLYSSVSVRGDWDDNKCNQHVASSSLAAQSGHNFSLPRYKTILDVNINAFERKPWRHPEADITEFFNFGFDEDSWKLYCNHVEQIRHQTFALTRTPVYDFSRPKEAYAAGTEYETGARKPVPETVAHNGQRRAVSPVSRNAYRKLRQFEMPKGRRIRVEDSMLERPPFMDVKRSVDRDPDVVIQIAVQDSTEDSSGSGKVETSHKGFAHDASESGDVDVDDEDVIQHSGTGSGNELSRKFVEGNAKNSGSGKRCTQLTAPSNPVSVDSDNHGSGQTSDVDEHFSQKVTGASSEGNAEATETSNHSKEEVCRDTCNTVPSMGETECLLADQAQHDLILSYSGIHCKEYLDDAPSDPERLQNHVRRQSKNPVSELQESAISDYYHHSNDSKNFYGRRKNRDFKYYARTRGPIPENPKHCSRRIQNDYESNCPRDYGPFPFSNTNDGYYSPVGRGRQDKKRLYGIDGYDGEDFSYYKGSELSYKYFGERVCYDKVQSTYSKKPHRNHHGFGDETDRDLSRWDGRDYFLEQRVSKVDGKVIGRDWNHYGRELTLNPLIHKESKRLASSYSSYLDKRRASRWGRKGDEFQFRKRLVKQDFVRESQYQIDLIGENYGYYGKERKYFDGKYERHLPYTRRGEKGSGRSGRKCDSPSADSDNLWAMSNEDDYWRCTNHQPLNSRSWREPHTACRGRGLETISSRNEYDLRLSERHGRYRRQISKESSRGSDWFDNYHDAGDTEGRVKYPGGQPNFGRRRHLQSESLHRTEGEYIYRQEDDEILAEEASFSFGRTSRHRRVGAKQKLIDVVEVEQHRMKLMREGSTSDRIERRSNIIDRGNHGKPLLTCRDSIDLHLVVGEGKSSARCSNAGSIICNDKHENADLDSEKEQMIYEDYERAHAEKAGQAGSPKGEINQNEEEWLDKFPVTEHNGALDIEEGQIITEVNENPEDENFGSENVTEISDERAKSLLVENVAKGNNVGEDYESPRILEVMAKMEKRRERFKEPITLKKDTQTIPKAPVDHVLETTAENKQQRPARKRRWGGS